MALRKERISERLAELRERDGLTQEQAAAKIPVTLRQWQRWEAGESMPYPNNLELVASKFGLSIEEFFDERPRQRADEQIAALQAEVSELREGLRELSLTVLANARARRTPRYGSSKASKGIWRLMRSITSSTTSCPVSGWLVPWWTVISGRFLCDMRDLPRASAASSPPCRMTREPTAPSSEADPAILIGRHHTGNPLGAPL